MSSSSSSKATTTTVVSLKKAQLSKRGYTDFADWASRPGHVYIGRGNRFVRGAETSSKWANPFSVKTHGRTKCLELYESHVLGHPELRGCLEELRGKELGCWCKPEACHGDILVKMLEVRTHEFLKEKTSNNSTFFQLASSDSVTKPDPLPSTGTAGASTRTKT